MFIYYLFLITANFTFKIVKCQNLYITNPSTHTLWKINDFSTIEWSNSEPDVEFETIKIDILKGDSNNGDFVLNIVTNLPGKSTSYIWTVPPNLKNSDDYFLKITGTTSTKTYVNYSVKFSIKENDNYDKKNNKNEDTKNNKNEDIKNNKNEDTKNNNNTIFISGSNTTINIKSNRFELKSIYVFVYMVLHILN